MCRSGRPSRPERYALGWRSFSRSIESILIGHPISRSPWAKQSNNAIEHAYGSAAGLVHLRGWFEGVTLVVEIRDHGRWRPEREEQRGRGVRIMRALSDRLDLNTTATTGTVARLTLLARPDRAASPPA